MRSKIWRASAFVLCFGVINAGPIPGVTHITPTASFRLADIVTGNGGGSTHVREFIATEDGLYFLTLDSVIHVDRSGKFVERLQPTPGMSLRHFAVDNHGTVSLEEIDETKFARSVRDLKHEKVLKGDALSYVLAMAYVGPTLWELASTSVLLPLNPAKAETPSSVVLSELGPTAEMATLDATRVVVADGSRGRLFVADTELNQVREIPLDAPELTASQRKADAHDSNGDGGSATIVDGLAAGPDEHIFMGLSFYRIAEGFPILEFLPDGVLIRRLRIDLPKDRACVALAVTKDKLFVLDSAAEVFMFSR